MALIFIKDRFTRNQSAFKECKKSDYSLLLTTANEIEEFSIELSIGDRWAEKLSADKPTMYEVEGKEITISPRSSIIVQTTESLCVPNNMFGMVMPTGRILLERGIFIANTKIEPTFSGKLNILLYNSSSIKRTLKQGDIIASAIFIRTEKTTDGKLITKEEPPIKKPKRWYQNFASFIRSDPKFIITLLTSILTSSLAATLFTYIIMQSPDSSKTAHKAKINIETQIIQDSQKSAGATK